MRALIVAHGQPSDPAPAEAELAALADAVAAHLPGWRVGHATLAASGALASALGAVGNGRRDDDALPGPKGRVRDNRAPSAAEEASERAPPGRAVVTRTKADLTQAGHAPAGRAMADPQAARPDTSDPGGPERAGQDRDGPALVYPMFMAGGWFTQAHLPARLRDAGGTGWRILPPFGTDPAVQDLTLKLAREAEAAGARALLLAAHGSFRSSAPSEIAFAMAARIARETGLTRVATAFIDQEPRLAAARGFGADAVCLPFFAAAGGHVRDDLPAALAAASFAGRLLPPVGLDSRVPALIAAAIRRGATKGAQPD